MAPYVFHDISGAIKKEPSNVLARCKHKCVPRGRSGLSCDSCPHRSSIG